MCQIMFVRGTPITSILRAEDSAKLPFCHQISSISVPLPFPKEVSWARYGIVVGLHRG